MARIATFLVLVWLLALPLTAWAQEEEEVTFFNPPDWVGWLMVILALSLPLIVYIWYRRQRM